MAREQVTAVQLGDRRLFRLGRRDLLFVYTAVEIVAGSAALAWAVLAVPIAPAISFTTTGLAGMGGSGGLLAPAHEATLVGLAFWSVLGLLGGTRVGTIHGYGVLTFHMPFIVAAAALGGPAAGGVVAFAGTTELRELRDAPWYGLLANHASLTLAGVAAGLAMLAGGGRIASLGLGSEPTALLAFAVGATAFVLVSVSLATMTSIFRDGITAREVVFAYTNSFRATMVTEVVVGWLLALTYRMVGWWAPVVAAAVIVRLVPLGPRPVLDHLALQGRVRSVGSLWPVGYLILRLEGWGQLVDACGRERADQLRDAVGLALEAAMFVADLGARTADNEWRLLLTRIRLDGTETAARKFHRAAMGPLAAAAMTCPAAADVTVRIGAGVADEGRRRGLRATDFAEQALFDAMRERVAIVIRTRNGRMTCDV